MFSPYIAEAQNLFGGYNLTNSGRSISATYSWEKEKSEFGLGLGYNINKIIQPDDQNTILTRRLYAIEPIHFLAFKTFYHHTIFRNLKHIQPFLFYDLQIRYSTTRTRLFLGAQYDSTLVKNKPEDGILYSEVIIFFGPYVWIDQNIGLGFDINITDQFYLRQKVGFGTLFFLGKDERLPASGVEWFQWQLGTLVNIELGYKFGKK